MAAVDLSEPEREVEGHEYCENECGDDGHGGNADGLPYWYLVSPIRHMSLHRYRADGPHRRQASRQPRPALCPGSGATQTGGCCYLDEEQTRMVMKSNLQFRLELPEEQLFHEFFHSCHQRPGRSVDDGCRHLPGDEVEGGIQSPHRKYPHVRPFPQQSRLPHSSSQP